MTAREYLEQIGKIEKLIKNKLIEKEQWYAIATNTVPQSYGEKVQTTGNPQKMAHAVERLVIIDDEINAEIDRLVDTKKEIISVIEQLGTEEYDLLHTIYVQFYTLKEAAYKCCISYTNATTMHGRALKNVQKILDRKGEESNGTINNIHCSMAEGEQKTPEGRA